MKLSDLRAYLGVPAADTEVTCSPRGNLSLISWSGPLDDKPGRWHVVTRCGEVIALAWLASDRSDLGHEITRALSTARPVLGVSL